MFDRRKAPLPGPDAPLTEDELRVILAALEVVLASGLPEDHTDRIVLETARNRISSRLSGTLPSS